MANRIDQDGSVKPVLPANGSDFTLDELHALVGCDMIELVYLRDGSIMVIDEEAKVRGEPKPYNSRATAIARKAGISPDDWISGHALICRKGEIK